jgi:hypothetical protein
MNRRIPNGTYGGGRGRGLAAPSYSIKGMDTSLRILHGGEPELRLEEPSG